jgi:hypothetical protein
MKKVFAVLLALSLLAGAAFAADAKKAEPTLEPLVAGGDLLVNVGIGWGGLAAGAELDLITIKAGPLPLTFGAGARAAIDPIFIDYGMPWAIGAFGMGHVGFKGLDLSPSLEWLSKTDTYIGLGLGFAGISANSDYDWYTWKPGVGISFIAGESYFLTDKLALYGEYGYIGTYRYEYDWYGITYSATYHPYYATVGVILKLLGK